MYTSLTRQWPYRYKLMTPTAKYDRKQVVVLVVVSQEVGRQSAVFYRQ